MQSVRVKSARKMPLGKLDEMRRNLEREIHAAHRRIDFEAQERRIHQSIEEGRMSEEDGERRLVEMHRRMESEERRMHDRERMRRHHEEREHRGERRYWEDEEELWEQVAQGLKAAVRLGRMSEGEAVKFGKSGGTMMKTKIMSTIMF